MIETSELRFSYGSEEVLRGVNLKICAGHTYGLLGENGAGKTTLLHLLTGLSKPLHGSISVDGAAPFGRKPEMLSEIFFLQDTMIPVKMQAAQYAAVYGPFWKGFDIDLFHHLMQLFSTDGNKRMDRMSLGQLKKTYVSFAIACRPAYLFMDEPTNGMDIPSKATFRQVVREYAQSPDKAVVISTHQVHDVEGIIDVIHILQDGCIREIPAAGVSSFEDLFVK